MTISSTMLPLPSFGSSLGLARTASPQPTAPYAQHEVTLPPATTAAMQVFAQQHSVTLPSLVHGAWALLLSRYSREKEVGFGSIVPGNLAGPGGGQSTTAEHEARMPTSVWIHVPSDASVLSWLTTLEGQLAAGRQSVSAPAAENSARNGVPEGSALYETLLIVERGDADGRLHTPLRDSANTDHTTPIVTGSALTIVVTLGRQIALHVHYDSRRFDADAMVRLLGHLQIVLEGMVAKPEQPLTQVPLLTAAERHQLLVEWNDTRIDYPKNQCLHQLIEAQVARTPDVAAVVFAQQRLTYQELDARANQLAHHLRTLGVGPDVLVGVCLQRSLELMVALLGVLKAGGAYVPLDPDYPRDRLAFMLQDAQTPVLLTHSSLAPELPKSQARFICLDKDWGQISREPSTPPVTEVTAAHLAYMIYTSGSTGKPKGALNTHRGICNRLLWMQEMYQLSAADRVLQKTPCSFDVSVWEFFWPLMTGAGVVLARPRGHQDPSYLAQLIMEQQITVLHFVPSMLRIFLDEPYVEQCSSLRQVICSGEALSYELVQRFFQRLGARLDNLYGPTEAAVDVTYWRCERDDQRGIVPIGRPIANTQIYILDPSLQPTPIGAPGELHIGGVQVGRGYLNRPELTAGRFIADPFSHEPDARLYKTGDLARYLPDGSIEFLGRLDDQVKIRGNRIELGEIEAALREHPGIHDAAVLAQEYAPGDWRLVAYLVPDSLLLREKGGLEGISSTGSQLIDALRDRLQQQLPDYMMPASFVLLEQLPLSPNGKVDRKALAAPTQTRSLAGQGYVAPRTELERYLANLWREILKLDTVGIHHKFFEVGGNSLLGALVINDVRRTLDEMIYIVALFEAPTIAQFAAYLSAHYAAAVAKAFGTDSAITITGKKKTSRPQPPEEKTITVADVTAMRHLLPSFEPQVKAAPTERKNPPALFILSTHRSGTTLLRVMLAGHPALFAVPELQLLGFATLQARKAAFTGKYHLWLEGAIRALMEIRRCGPEEAKRLMAEYESRGLTTKEFFRLLQEHIAPRLLVDKTPSYVLDPVALQRAEEFFDGALYIHLTRHPYGMIRSFENFHINQVLLTREHPYTARQFAELVWTISHQNVLAFLSRVPRERQCRMKFEDLTSRPQAVMEEMCATLGLAYHPALIHPYEDTAKKLLDGLYAESTSMDDPKFQAHGRIDQTVADTWREELQEDFLGEVTWQVAETLGYERAAWRREKAEGVSTASATAAPSPHRTLFQHQRELRKSRRSTRAER